MSIVMSAGWPPQPQAGSSKHSMDITRNPSLRIRRGVRDNNVPLLSRLQHKMDLRNTDKNRLTSLSWAAIDGSLEVFEWLLIDYGHDDQELSRDADNNTMLHLLASIPSPPTMSPHTHHLSSSAFPARPSTRSIPEQIEICLRMTELYLAIFPFLLDWSNSGGKTALHVAAQAGNHQFISLLCDSGADVDVTDLQGNTPLHYASAWGHIETIQVLLERGCQFATRNSDGFTASDFAFSHTVKTALENAARDLFEERRHRRKVEVMSASGSNGSGTFMSPPLPEGRLRSASVSTNKSIGSTSVVSSNHLSTSVSGSFGFPRRRSNGQSPPPVASAVLVDGRVRSPPRRGMGGSGHMWRRESEPSKTRPTPPPLINIPPVPPIPPSPAEPRPVPSRSPSLPVHSSASRPPLGPPILGPAVVTHTPKDDKIVGIPMRRANSSQTNSSTNSEKEAVRLPTPPRLATSTSNRGTPI